MENVFDKLKDTMIVMVKFEFDVQGDFEEAKKSIREQISSDDNAYCVSDDTRAQLVRWEIIDFRTK